MCNVFKSSMNPATDALERASKRPRVCSSATEAALDLLTVFDAITAESGELEFPSIGWDLDEPQQQAEIALPTSLGMKRDRNGLVRSKSFKTNLVSLEQESRLNSLAKVGATESLSQLATEQLFSPGKIAAVDRLSQLATDALLFRSKLDHLPRFPKESHLVKMSKPLMSLYKDEPTRERQFSLV